MTVQVLWSPLEPMPFLLLTPMHLAADLQELHRICGVYLKTAHLHSCYAPCCSALRHRHQKQKWHCLQLADGRLLCVKNICVTY